MPDFVGGYAGSHRSPFIVSSVEFVRCYATSAKRCNLLDGLFTYRGRLRAVGLTGVQWLDGSFVGDVESREGREPGDIDVVTFFASPRPQQAVAQQDPTLFDHAQVKVDHGLDAFPLSVNTTPWALLALACYWHGMWSRSKATRIPVMKGYLALRLDASDADDKVAVKELATLAQQQGSQP